MTTPNKPPRRPAVRRPPGQCACGRMAAPDRKQCERYGARKAANDAAQRERVRGKRLRVLPTGYMIPDDHARSGDTVTRRDCALHDACLDAFSHAHSGHARCGTPLKACEWFKPAAARSAVDYTSSGTYNADAAIYAGGS